MSFTLSPRLRDAYDRRAATNPRVPPLNIPWGYQQVADYLDVKQRTVKVYRERALRHRRDGNASPGDLPDPDGSAGAHRGQWWYPKTIIKWDRDDRPGQGIGGGRPWHKEQS